MSIASHHKYFTYFSCHQNVCDGKTRSVQIHLKCLYEPVIFWDDGWFYVQWALPIIFRPTAAFRAIWIKRAIDARILHVHSLWNSWNFMNENIHWRYFAIGQSIWFLLAVLLRAIIIIIVIMVFGYSWWERVRVWWVTRLLILIYGMLNRINWKSSIILYEEKKPNQSSEQKKKISEENKKELSWFIIQS